MKYLTFEVSSVRWEVRFNSMAQQKDQLLKNGKSTIYNTIQILRPNVFLLIGCEWHYSVKCNGNGE